MPNNKIKRPKFFEGQYLGADDLRDGVRYSHVQRARHMLGAHTWGIAVGLKLKEVPGSGGNDQVDVYLTPGYAWDGFGRPIVVLAPYQIPTEKFKSCAGEEDIGSLIKVWLRYDETAIQRPRPGFEVCDLADQFNRVQETFRVEVGGRPNLSDRHDPIILAGHSLKDDTQALQDFEPEELHIHHQSIPHQVLPDDDDDAWWLIPLGYVRWKPNPHTNQPGHFLAMTDEDKVQNRRLRQYIGVVAEGIQAADGIIRLRDRTIRPSRTWSDDLVWVEGDLRVDEDIKLFGGQLDFRDRSGKPREDDTGNGVPLVIKRIETIWGSDLQVLIGQSESGHNRFVVGSRVDNNFAARLVIRDDGHVGIGAVDPTERLDVRGNIKLGANGNLFAVGCQQILRVIVGHVNLNGTPANGDGFSSSRSDSETGQYVVKFTPPFPSTPVVLSSPVNALKDDNLVTIKDISKESFVAITTDIEGVMGGMRQDTEFSFIALGAP